MYALVRKLIDGRATRVLGWMTHAERKVGQMQPTVDLDRPEDHAEAPHRLRQIDLGAVRQHGAVASLPLHATQVLDGNPVPLVGSPGSFGGVAPSGSRAREVFLPAVEIEVRGKAARLRARHSYGSPSGGSMSDA